MLAEAARLHLDFDKMFSSILLYIYTSFAFNTLVI